MGGGGKDPGLSPLSLLDLLRRHGRYRSEDFGRLRLVEALDLEAAKRVWLSALEDADRFCRERPPDEYGCLYFSTREQGFVIPSVETPLAQQGVVLHFATLGGVLPRIADQSIGA